MAPKGIVHLFLVLCIASLPSYAQFGSRIDSGTVVYSVITEASGIAASRQNPGVIWTHNDAGDVNRIYAMRGNGAHLGIYYLNNAVARDWEDIADGPGPESSKSYIYVGNIGDNDTVYDIKFVYRCVEPVVSVTQTAKTDTISDVDVLQYRYPDGKKNAEALMVDPLTKDYYIISKDDAKTYVYKAAYPQPVGTVDTLECVDTLDLVTIVSADIAPAGNEILIKNYTTVYYWKILGGQSIQTTLLRTPVTISTYTEEPQGEALAWDYNASGYFTLSEENGSDCHLYYYPRILSINSGISTKKSALNLNPSTVISMDGLSQNNAYLLSGKKTVKSFGNTNKTKSAQVIISNDKQMLK